MFFEMALCYIKTQSASSSESFKYLLPLEMKATSWLGMLSKIAHGLNLMGYDLQLSCKQIEANFCRAAAFLAKQFMELILMNLRENQTKTFDSFD